MNKIITLACFLITAPSISGMQHPRTADERYIIRENGQIKTDPIIEAIVIEQIDKMLSRGTHLVTGPYRCGTLDEVLASPAQIRTLSPRQSCKEKIARFFARYFTCCHKKYTNASISNMPAKQ